MVFDIIPVKIQSASTTPFKARYKRITFTTNMMIINNYIMNLNDIDFVDVKISPLVLSTDYRVQTTMTRLDLPPIQKWGEV